MTTPLRTLIVDDEAPARREMIALLAGFPELKVIGEAATGNQAIARCAELHPDLLFLDVQMPGKTGFEVMQALPPPAPRVIFTTAHDHFAVRAFEVNALDYLLKPISPERLGQAVARLFQAPAPEAPGSPAPPLTEDDRVLLREGDHCWFVPVTAIVLLEAQGNHTRLHFDGQHAVVYRTLSAMEARLPGALFLRANRSQMINLRAVENVEAWFSGCFKVRLRGGQEIELSRRQSTTFRERLSL